jgi:hypothetical protein
MLRRGRYTIFIYKMPASLFEKYFKLKGIL